MKTKSNKPIRRRRNGAGYSIPGAADELDVAYKTLRTAIDLGQAKTIEFGGQQRVPTHEVKRLSKLFRGEAAE
jgi:hypothetical protein